MLLRRHSRRFSLRGKLGKKGVGKIFIVLLVLGALGYFFLIRPIFSIIAQAKELEASAKEVKAAMAESDLVKVEKKLKETKLEYDSLEREASKLYWARFIPFVGAYASDVKNAVEAGSEMLDAGVITVLAIEPYADLVGFKKGESASFVDRPAEERLQTAVLTLDKIVDDVDDIAKHVDSARNKVAKIDPKRYPKSVFGHEIRPKVENVKDGFEGMASLFVDAKPLIKNLPEILGAEEERMYIVLFMNDKELRPTGGFITAYAVFKVNQGKFTVHRSSDIYALDASIPRHPKAPREIAAYHKGVSKLYIRDSNLSPDYVKSVKLFDKLYQDSSEKVDYDGIIAVDTNVLVDALEILGDTEVRGILFSAKQDKRCDCPQVIYRLLDEIDRPVAYIKNDRKGILGDLLLTLTQKALGFSPSRYWGRLSQMAIRNLQEKHVLVYMTSKQVQKSIEDMNFGGRIENTEGDYLHINDTNFAGAKSNLYVQHFVKSETEIASDGTVTRTVTIDYKNPRPHSNCNLEFAGEIGSGGLCINATLRNWLRLYVPEGSRLIDFKGSEKKVQEYDDLDKTVFEGFMKVKPLGKATVTVKYELPFKVEDVQDYTLLVQKQPGTVGHEYTVVVNGNTIKKTKLTEDMKFRTN